MPDLGPAHPAKEFLGPIRVDGRNTARHGRSRDPEPPVQLVQLAALSAMMDARGSARVAMKPRADASDFRTEAASDRPARASRQPLGACSSDSSRGADRGGSPSRRPASRSRRSSHHRRRLSFPGRRVVCPSVVRPSPPAAVSEHEGRLVSHIQVPAQCQRGVARDLFAEHRDGREIVAERHLVESEQRAAGDHGNLDERHKYEHDIPLPLISSY